MAVHRIAVVTGATSGIGRATAQALAAAGYAVLATGRREERLTALAAETRQLPGEVFGVPADVTAEAVIPRLFEAAEERWAGPVDTFVVSAGHGVPGTLLSSDEKRWRELIEVNQLAVARQLRDCARRFVDHAEQATSRSGQLPVDFVRDIVVIGSTIGRQVSAFNPVYGSTKFAVHALVEGLRQEVCGHNIRTTLIEPGFVCSEFQQVAGYDMDWFASLEKQSGPFLEAEDIARSIAFVLAQPPHVHLDDIRIRPTRQKV